MKRDEKGRRNPMSKKRKLLYPVRRITLTIPLNREYKIMDNTAKRLGKTHAEWLRWLILTYGDRVIPGHNGSL